MPYKVKLPPTPPSRRPPTLEELFAKADAKAGHHPPPPPDPRAGLWRLLDLVEVIRATGATVERHEIADRIMDLFSSFPGDAPGWQRDWQAAHPCARLR